MKRGDIHRWRRVGGILEPIGPHARKALGEIGEGEIVSVQFTHDRNLDQMRAYFAMLRNVVAATGEWPSVAALGFEISVALKSGEAVVDKEGRTHWIPASRSASAMTQEAFNDLFRDTEAWLTERLGCHPDELRKEQI